MPEPTQGQGARRLAGDFIAFAGDRRIARGDLATVSRAVRAQLRREPRARVLVFDAVSGRQLDVDGERIGAPVGGGEGSLKKAGPGRPKLGVIAREVTLLPRHWEWLAAQPGGASVALRKLVEDARRSGGESGRVREARDATYRFMTVMAGDLPHYEEALRALYAGDNPGLLARVADWPADIAEQIRDLARSIVA